MRTPTTLLKSSSACAGGSGRMPLTIALNACPGPRPRNAVARAARQACSQLSHCAVCEICAASLSRPVSAETMGAPSMPLSTRAPPPGGNAADADRRISRNSANASASRRVRRQPRQADPWPMHLRCGRGARSDCAKSQGTKTSRRRRGWTHPWLPPGAPRYPAGPRPRRHSSRRHDAIRNRLVERDCSIQRLQGAYDLAAQLRTPE